MPNLSKQTDEDVFQKSVGCVQCHADVRDMHDRKTVKLGCTDCHGGNAHCTSKEDAHVRPRFPDAWTSAANPVRSYTLLNHEDPEFIRFVNPGDLRVASIACGGCHQQEVLAVKKGMMTHGCMLWGAALYNNGSVPHKRARFGESYSMNGAPQRIKNTWRADELPDHERDVHYRGMVPFLDPLPRYEISQPGNVLRIFETGGRFRAETGIPERLEESGRPRGRLSNRGLGTENRTDPVFIGLQKSRLLDPTLNFMGTNDHPGDYRSSGCTACHVIYANDRSAIHSGPYAKHGNLGQAALDPDQGLDRYVKTVDPTINKLESGHPIAHRFTSAIPTSQCIVCHMHPGTSVLNTYIGYMWWDNETDGELMYPPEQKYPTSEEFSQAQLSNPEEASVRGNWSDPQFLNNLTSLNVATKHTQFADFHSHGWAFRAVWKKDRRGYLLDYQGKVLQDVSNPEYQNAVAAPSEMERVNGKCVDDQPVHLLDIHMEKGMHCVDCHFNQDVHGNTKLYGEVRAAIEITCTDCHGTSGQSIPQKLLVQKQKGEPVRMITTGPAAPTKPDPNDPTGQSKILVGHNLLALKTPFGKPRFEWKAATNELIQNSMVHEDRSWPVKQTRDTLDPTHKDYNIRSHQAKTVRWDTDGTLAFGGIPDENENFGNECAAHKNSNMSCMSCHSSWNPSCFGCHLPQKANKKAPDLHNEGDVSRNQVSYNFQTLRDDVFMLARDGFASGNKINPARSSCAVHVTSYNNNRESIYTQQQTISGSGLSGIAFSTNVPHTVRGGSPVRGPLASGTSETKQCTDCHLSKENDNNAIMAQLLMQGTNYVNFIGRFCWVAGGEQGFEAVSVTERDEPQAVIGSSLHRLAYPDFYAKHLQNQGVLKHAHRHPGKDISGQITAPFRKNEILSLQARGEYLYAACGQGGLRVFDIAFIDDKGFSKRITTAPVSPLGQRFFVPSTYATCVAAPTTIAPDPTRTQLPENHEQPVHAIYGYLFFTDSTEGLITVPAATLLDGIPVNNFLERETTYNPNGLLKGARFVTIVGTYAYVCCDAGLVIINYDDPKHPVVANVIGSDILRCPTSVQVQFRYAYVCDEEGVKAFDVTNLAAPVEAGVVHLKQARKIYLARTYAYVAAGEEGLVILDITKPHEPHIDQVYNAGGCMNDVHDVKLGITNASEFAYVADGCNGLRVLQLSSPDTPGSAGFSPRPVPQLIASYKLQNGGHALAIAEGVDRDRAVDESGNQIAVFGRIGARPLSKVEQQRMYLRLDPAIHKDRTHQPWFVSDDPFDPIYERSREVPKSWQDILPRRRVQGPVSQSKPAPMRR